jgi:hypothetical protein
METNDGIRSADWKKAKLASLIMLSAAVIFNLYVTYPVMSPGVNDAGDDLHHVSQAYYMKKLIVEEHTIFGVVHSYGVGYPWFNTRQFLIYAAEAAVNLLSFDSISLLDAHKGLLMLLYSFFPLGVYYMLDKYRQPPILCGIGALLAPLPISGWGNTLDAYFAIGLTSQVAGAFLFPFALGSFHQLITEGKGPRKTALLYVLTLFGHPYYGNFLIITSTLDVAIHMFRKSRPEAVKIMKYAATAGTIAFLLVVFWAVPLPETMKYAPRSFQMQAVKGAFNLQNATKYLIDGELLDVTNNFGDETDKNMRWPNNTNRGRLPVLTALGMLGLIYAAAKRDRFLILCAAGFIISFVLILGIDDIPLLKYVPMAEYFNAKRTIYLLEFFTICLSASSLHWVMSGAYSLSKRINAQAVGAAFAAAILIGTLYTPYNERMLSADKAVNTLNNWIPNYDAMRAAIKEDGIDGRTHSDDDTIKGAPQVLSQPWLLDTPNMRRIFATRFWGNPLDYPNVLGLFNIRYYMTGPGAVIPEASRPILTNIYKDRIFRLYRVEGDYGYLALSHKKPDLLESSEDGWRTISEVWLHYYKNNSQKDSMPLIVEDMGQEIDKDMYSTLLKFDKEPDGSLLEAFNGRVYNGTAQPHNTIRTVLKDSKRVDAKDSIRVVSRTQDRILAVVETDKDALLTFKVEYHPNWRAIVDGTTYETLRATPEFPAVFIKPGRHMIEFRYEQSLFQKFLNLVSFATLLYVLMPLSMLGRIKSALASGQVKARG